MRAFWGNRASRPAALREDASQSPVTAEGRRHRSRQCRAIGLATALGLVLAVGALAPTLAAPALDDARATAWADNLDNKDVPTDDTGVVDASGADSSAPSGDATSAEEGGSTENAAGGAEPSTETAPSGGAAGEAAAGEDASADAGAEATEPPVVVPDPVFGTGRNEKNLLNPQQKPDSSFIYDTSIKALQEADPYLNDQTVRVTGEVVGDRIRAEFDPGFCWIVLQSNDGSYTEVPVFLSTVLTEPIDTYGAYGRKGTTLQIRGTFHLACPDHEGLTDLHADTASVVAKGHSSEREFDIGAFLPGIVLVMVGLIMLLVFRHMREGQR